MPNTGYKPCQTIVSTGDWEDFTVVRLEADDAVRAQTLGTTASLGVIRNFDFSAIPIGSTIDGVEIQADLSCRSTTNTDYLNFRISKDGGTNWSDYCAEQSRKGQSDEVKNFGGAADLWGLTLSAAEVKDTTNFQVTVRGYSDDGKRYARVDYVWVRITYTDPPPERRSSFFPFMY